MRRPYNQKLDLLNQGTDEAEYGALGFHKGRTVLDCLMPYKFKKKGLKMSTCLDLTSAELPSQELHGCFYWFWSKLELPSSEAGQRNVTAA